MFDSVKKGVKSIVSVCRASPKAFRTVGTRFVVRNVVIEKFCNAHTSGEFVKVCINFRPADLSWIWAKGETSCEKLRLVICESDVR